MSVLQDASSVLHSSALSQRPGLRKSKTSSDLQSSGAFNSVLDFVRNPTGVVGGFVEGWYHGLSKEEREERIQTAARKTALYLALRNATTYKDWHDAALELDDLEGNNAWKHEVESPEYDADVIQNRLQQLDDARANNDIRRMVFLIRTALTRNLGNMGNVKLYKHSHVGTKDLIERYIDTTLDTLNTLLDFSEKTPIDGYGVKAMLDQVLSARQAFGRSALLLSGGGTFGMNHSGVLKALFEAKLLPRIMSGASAGSIVCAALCTRIDEEVPELLQTFIESDFEVFDGPGEGTGATSVLRKVARFLKHGSVYDVSNLINVMREMLGDITFQEAYNRTRRILNICVSSAGQFELPRLLNYITAPNVLIWSAVAASCSVPFVFSAAEILAKDSKTGEAVPWNSSPQKWIDGSVENDIPITRLAEMFNVNHFIVSQVNPHVVPFLEKEEDVMSIDPSLGEDTAVRPSSDSSTWLHTMATLAKSEALFRLHTLAEFGVFPTTLTKTMSILSQKYSGDITILPEIHYTDFPSILANPTAEYRKSAMLAGERATWPKLSRVRNHVAIELALDDAVQRLRTRVVFSASQADLRLNSFAGGMIGNKGGRRTAGGLASSASSTMAKKKVTIPEIANNSRRRRKMSQSSMPDESAVDEAGGKRYAQSTASSGSRRKSIAKIRDSLQGGNSGRHSKAKSVQLPPPASPEARSSSFKHGYLTPVTSPPTDPNNLHHTRTLSSSGAETNFYTSDSPSDHSSDSSLESPDESTPSPAKEKRSAGGYASFFPSFSVPATPSAAQIRHNTSFTSFVKPILKNAAAVTGTATGSTSSRAPPPPPKQPASPPSGAEAKYKRLFHGGAGADVPAGVAPPPRTSSAAANRSAKRMNAAAAGLAIDVGGAEKADGAGRGRGKGKMLRRRRAD